jgi:hypothetical protein
MMALAERELEKKNLTEIGALIRGYEKKSKELAIQVGAGNAKPTDLMTLNSDLAMLKKVLDKKITEQKRLVPQASRKDAPELKSYDDYLREREGKDTGKS